LLSLLRGVVGPLRYGASIQAIAQARSALTLPMALRRDRPGVQLLVKREPRRGVEIAGAEASRSRRSPYLDDTRRFRTERRKAINALRARSPTDAALERRAILCRRCAQIGR